MRRLISRHVSGQPVPSCAAQRPFVAAVGDRRKRQSKLAMLVSALAVAVINVPVAQATVIITGDSNATISAEDHLITSIPGTFTGVNVADLVGASRFYAAGVTGQNTIAANVESGHIWSGHETLGHVTTFVADPSTFTSPGNSGPEFHRHSTWVGMIIGGRNIESNPQAYQTGIASGTDLRSGAVATAWLGNAYSGSWDATDQTLATAYGAFFGSADVINSSWGETDPTGSATTALMTDGLANQNPMTTFVVSAGNSGPAANTVGSPGSAYNNIAVAALQNNGANIYDSVASFSSRGPQDYWDPVNGLVQGVRAAVDIAAPGTNLTSAYYGGQTGGNNPTLPGSVPSGGPNYYSGGLAGTSFAAPIVAGGVALLDSASKNDAALSGNPDSRDARVIKAVLMNSADKIAGWDNGQQNVGGVITTSQSLDWASGAGALNLDRAYDQYITAGTRDVAGLGGGTVEEVGWDYGQVGIGQTNSYLIDDYLLGGSIFTVTLDWFRERIFDLTGLIGQDIAQANLDLIVRDLISNTIVAESISIFNNVEHLSFLLPNTSRYAIDVAYIGNIFGSITAEQYGLAWQGTATALPTPSTLALLLVGLLSASLVRRRPRITRMRP